MSEYIYLVIGNTVLGMLVRVIIVVMMLATIRSLVKDKKKKKSVSLEIKDKNTKVFIGYVGVGSFIYFFILDLIYGFDENFNSFIWLGMFFIEIYLALGSIFKKYNARKEEKVNGEKDVNSSSNVSGT
jgi:amino acid transporter